MSNGIIVVDKPQGWTSLDVCARLRRAFKEKHIGHSGTLDPMATGVLPVFVGRATRAVAWATDSEKEYVAQVKLGVVTDTQDSYGNVLEENPVSVTLDDINAVLPRFQGEILQIPPMYSAIKKNGAKLYELARRGEEVEREPRLRHIYALEADRWNGTDQFRIRVRCSKGTYIRTLCHDIGAALGCGGSMGYLCRTMAGGFKLSEAIPLKTLLDHPAPVSLLKPVDALFSDRPAVTLEEKQERQYRNGMSIALQGEVPEGEVRAYGVGNAFLGLARVEKGKLSAIRNFFDI